MGSKPTSLGSFVAPGAAVATLTKAFGAAQITPGASTSLTFTLTAQGSGGTVSFTDTLPTGLKLASMTVGGTCTGGTVDVSNDAFVRVAGKQVVPAVPSCTVIVNVTNRSAGNASCAGNPSAFTNSGLNLSGLVNVTSVVVPICLAVIDLGRLNVPTSFTFPAAQTVGFATQTPITIQNLGGTNVLINSVVPAGDFTSLPGSNACASNQLVTTGSFCILTVQFLPLTDGTRTGSIVIASTPVGGTQVAQTLQLTGTGIFHPSTLEPP